MWLVVVGVMCRVFRVTLEYAPLPAFACLEQSSLVRMWLKGEQLKIGKAKRELGMNSAVPAQVQSATAT
jgi:hypothetical protein